MCVVYLSPSEFFFSESNRIIHSRRELCSLVLVGKMGSECVIRFSSSSHDFFLFLLVLLNKSLPEVFRIPIATTPIYFPSPKYISTLNCIFKWNSNPKKSACKLRSLDECKSPMSCPMSISCRISPVT